MIAASRVNGLVTAVATCSPVVASPATVISTYGSGSLLCVSGSPTPVQPSSSARRASPAALAGVVSGSKRQKASRPRYRALGRADHARVGQPGHLGRLDAQMREHLGRVLAHARGRGR